MNFKLGVIGIIIGSLLTLLPIESLANSETVQVETNDTIGWQKVNGIWYYYSSSGVKQIGWQKIDGIYYYFENSGAMRTGWLKEGNTWYYLKPSGAMQTGWQKVNGTWYYMNASGAMQTGWQKLDGLWYYMDSSGAMLTGWQDIRGARYYLNSSGAMLTGWNKIDGNWYYFYSGGSVATNTEIDGWLIDVNGVATKIEQVQNGWLQVGNDKLYYIEGVAQIGLIDIESERYYFNEKGIMQTGWQIIDNVKYYFYESGQMATNTEIDGWLIDSNGVANKIDVNDLESDFLIEVENLIVEKVNKERLKQGVPILCQNTLMQSYARLKAKDMGERGYFSHENPEGELVIDFIERDGVAYSAWGENIAYIMPSTIDFSNPDELAEEFVINWMNSQGHRKNILSTAFESIGVGLYKVDNQYYAVQEFYR